MMNKPILTAIFVATCVVFPLSLRCTFAADGQKSEPSQQGRSASDTSRAANPRAVPGSEEDVSVVFTVRIIHTGERPIAKPQIRMRLPFPLPQQDVGDLQIEGQPQREFDFWKEPLIVYRQPELAPGRILTGRWTAECRVRELKWDLANVRQNAGPTLTAEEKALYLRDAKYLDINSPTIKAAVEKATAGCADTVSKLEGIFDLVMKRLKYDRDGRWAPAPEVLASGRGSCSEYSYLFIALCRASGIPARYVGGITGRPGSSFHVDLVYHRFPQAFVDGVGWVDFDPTRNQRAKNHRLFFGRTPCQMLLLCAGDGKGSLTGRDYRCLELWNGKTHEEDDDSEKAPNYTPSVAVRVGWWFARPPADIRQKVAAFRKSLEETPPEQRARLVNEASKIGHPFVLPWLDDLLYDPAARVAAAKTLLKIGGKEAVVAVVDTLARQNDRDGDRQIGELLDKFTGRKFGADRKQWKNWLKKHTPRSPLPES
jgi:hypothetical protein